MVNAQKWLDEKYPINRRNEITELDISKGRVKKWNGHERTLKGHLKLTGFTDLRTLICSSHQLTNLDVGECNNLRELDCSNNNLNSLNINNCFKLKKINCISNSCLEEISIDGCPELTEIRSDLTHDVENNRLAKTSLATYAKETGITKLVSDQVSNYDPKQTKTERTNQLEKAIEMLNKYNQQSSQEEKSNNWQELHKDFTNHRKEKWEEFGFNYSETEVWIKVNLKPSDYSFAWWLVREKNYSPERFLDSDIVEELRNEWSNYWQEWKKLHSEFNSVVRGGNTIIEWIKRGFNYQETKQWIASGLKPNEYNFAAYLKKNGFTSQQYTDFENKNAQEWLNHFYPQEKRQEIKQLDIRWKELKGDLDCRDFTNLEELKCSYNQLTSLKLSNCQKVRIIECNDNKLTNLNLTNCSNITELACNNNYLTDLDFLSDLNNDKLREFGVSSNNLSAGDLTPFSRFVNLKILNLGNGDKEKIEKGVYNSFSRSLESLKNLTNLEILDIENTDINGGLECLPNDIKNFYCSSSDRIGGTQKKTIDQELGKFGEAKYGNFAFLLRRWKEEKLKEELEEEKTNVKNLGDDILRSKELIKEQKDKIVKAWLRFAPEKELLRKLIIAELAFGKAKEREENISEFRKQRDEIYRELKEKIGDNLMEVEVEPILKDCNDLLALELDIRKKTKFLEEAFQKTISINISIKNIMAEEGSTLFIGNIIEGINEEYAKLIKNNYQLETDKIIEILEEGKEFKQELDGEPNKKCKINIMEETRNILLIGRTGNGKSTVANVISNTNKFLESSGSDSETRNIQAEEFEVEDDNKKLKYRIIDTVGISDTQLTEKSVLDKLGEAKYFIQQEGLSQVLFVLGDRFDEKEIDSFRLLKNKIFDDKIVDHTTIVRTKFPSYWDQEECEKEKKVLKTKNQEFSQIINSDKIIFVENPSLKCHPDDVEKVKKKREETRRRLADYLKVYCQDVYWPSGFLSKKNETSERSQQGNSVSTTIATYNAQERSRNFVGNRIDKYIEKQEKHHHTKKDSTTVEQSTDYSGNFNVNSERSQVALGDNNKLDQDNGKYISETLTPPK